MPWNISASQIKLWLQCPWAYHLRYGLGIQPEDTPDLQRGRRIHESIFSYLRKGKYPFTFKPLVSYLDGWKSIEPRIEKPFLQIGSREFRLVLIPDILYEDKIVDLKTVAYPNALERVSEADLVQMTFYSYHLRLPVLVVKVLDAPFSHFKIHEVEIDPGRLEVMDGAIEEIVRYHFEGQAEPRPGPGCRDCLLLKYCEYGKSSFQEG